jgi:hypothetical protein
MADSVALDNAVPPLTQHIEALSVANTQSQKQIDELTAQIKEMEVEEVHINIPPLHSDSQQNKTKQDKY